MIPVVKKRGINFTDLVMYLAVALKHLRLIVLLLCFSLMLGLVYYVYAKPVYYGSSLVRYKYTPLPVDTEKIFRDSGDREFLPQLTAPHIIARAAKRLGIEGDQGNKFRDQIAKVSASFNSERNIVIDVWTYSPVLAKTFGEAMLQEFLLNREEQRAQYRENTVKNFTQEMSRMTEKMKEELNSRFNYREANDATKILIEMERIRELPRQMVVVKNRLAAMDMARETLKNTQLDTIQKLSLLTGADKNSSLAVGQVLQGYDEPGGKAKQNTTIVVTPSNLDSGQKPWEEQSREKMRLERSIQELDKTYRPAHPKMTVLNKELQKVNLALETEFQIAQEKFNQEYASLLEKKAELERKIPEYDAILKKNEKFQLEYDLTQSSQLSWDKMYSEMARQLSTLDYGGEKERVQLQYLGMIELRDQVPVSPHRLKLVLVSLAIGLVLAVGVPFLLEFLDHTVSNAEEIEQFFQIRGLGIVPKIDDSQLAMSPLVQDNKSDRQLLENFRVIRTNLISHGMLTKIPHVVMVASAMPQEGKTVVSTNLAMSFAQMGEKTLLIDADLRRGRLHRVFGFKASPGLSNVLKEGVSLDDACRPTSHENLTILPCGKHLDGATELLGSPKFAQLMSQFRQEYQRIVVDTPPVLGLSETSMMQSLVDGVLFVIWSAHTPLRNVTAAVDILRANRANIYGFVLNRLDLSNSPNYYHYYYYSSNYYKSYQALGKI